MHKYEGYACAFRKSDNYIKSIIIPIANLLVLVIAGPLRLQKRLPYLSPFHKFIRHLLALVGRELVLYRAKMPKSVFIVSDGCAAILIFVRHFNDVRA